MLLGFLEGFILAVFRGRNDKINNMITPLEVAERFVGNREVTRNASPEIAKLWPDTSYPDGMKNREPYCSAFVCHALAQASREGWKHKATKLPKEAAVRNFLKWCQNNKGVLLFQPNTPEKIKSIQAGDIFIMLPKTSHIGFVKLSNGRDQIRTTEGNTDGSGGREGDGFYNKSRSISSIGWIARFL